MIHHATVTDQALHALLRQGKIQFAGNQRLHIYGTLHCRSGKRMKRVHRVFFSDADEAIALGYRPCGHCMRQAYRNWKHGFV